MQPELPPLGSGGERTHIRPAAAEM